LIWLAHAKFAEQESNGELVADFMRLETANVAAAKENRRSRLRSNAGLEFLTDQPFRIAS
jgi:hypothetical protein